MEPIDELSLLDLVGQVLCQYLPGMDERIKLVSVANPDDIVVTIDNGEKWGQGMGRFENDFVIRITRGETR